MRNVLRPASTWLGLMAVAMQLSLPLLHEGHGPVAFAADVPVAVHSAACHHDDAPDHHAAPCSQCRTVSQLRDLAAPAPTGAVAALQTTWLPRSTEWRARDGLALDSSSPRAPPLFV